jgi:two-component system sensor histidine kinase/response regulator
MHTIVKDTRNTASARAQELFDQQWEENAARTDLMFAVLMIVQWLGAIITALVISPRAWNGSQSHVHPHVWLALCLGGSLASLPIYLAFAFPGRTLTRHVIALAQIMFSSLLIHVSGGRIETHFHVFGSLAFLAFYRDWKVLVPATVFVAVDHFVRGVYWPQTVFGITTAAPWRWLEHAAWVIYEDVFLFIACASGVRDMWSNAVRTAELERMNRDMQQQTAELESSYRTKNAIVETALDAVISMDQQGRITGWNSQAEAIFGWPAAEVLGNSVASTIIPSQFRDAHEQGLTRFLETGESRVLNKRIEVMGLHRDGHEFPVELAIAPIKSSDSVSFCAFVRDITVPQQAAEALRSAKEAAEAASYAKSAFLANMSHEIRTPLNAILGFTDVLKNQTQANAEQRDHLQTIHTSGRHLLTLINDVLDLSKIESGQMQIEVARCSPNEIIAATVSILRVPAQERGLTLEYHWKSQIPESIGTDPVRLRQILMNLIGNAVKFTEVGGIEVVARVQTDATPTLTIDVIDTGVGIDPKAGEHIFDPFVQADSSITRRFGGTGLGLSISRRLARLLGGDLTVNSKLGQGSIFTLTIPVGCLDGVPHSKSLAADVLAAPSNHADRPAPLKLPPCRILLVEDGVTNRKLFKLILERAGATVHCADNGQLGVHAARAKRFDLILMDMQMPVMDGYSATSELRRLGFTLPIIALTAHAMASDEQKCREAGCSGYLTKPINPESLLVAVASALDVSDAVDVLESAEVAEKSSAVNPVQDDAQEAIVSRLPTDDADFCEIICEFVAQFEKKLKVLRAAAECEELHHVAEIAHWIKGAGGTAGFDELTEPAAALEKVANQTQRDQVLPLVARLESLLARIQLPVPT